jgi:ABC-type nickel/cobalt efflux system permease component RcnA
VFTQIGYTLVIALGFYLIWTAIRLIIWLFRRKK